ncbi:penicillin-binding protein 1C [Hydrogenophaga sp. RWCD_12]|uniref:penicillin-binding protein 1C n=1 Tax=Hydrogenophaga sp. RWCD_12 TaxID=3391190 RepID=UPI003985643C
MKRRALPVGVLVGVLVGSFSLPAWALPSFAEVKAAHPTSETLFLDRHGEMLQRQRTDPSVRQGAWVALPEVSPALRSALVYSEDRRFYEHAGVDWQAVASAAWGNLWNTRTRGASTITMQLAGLLDGDLKAGAQGRSWTQKAGQAVWAQWLETRWRKDQILEAYLNRVPFRSELVGIDALSRSLFGKAPHGLDADEAAITAALVRAPNAAPERVADRACEVQQAMARAQGAKADCLSVRLLTGTVLRERRWAASEGDAPHATRRAWNEWRQQAGTGTRATPPQIRTTLWAPLQREAQTLLQRQLRSLLGRRVEDGAVVVLDNASGEVLAWVGSSGLLSQAAEVDGVTALRQPGSTLKPFLYAQAIAEKRLSAASLIEDAPTHIPTAAGLYIPQNYDRNFRGWVSVRTALASSLNIPAVRTLAMVSPEDFAAQLVRLGLPLREGGDYYGLGLALGSAEVTLLSLTNAYRTLANQGRQGPVAPLLASQRGAVGGSAVLDPGAAFIVGDILSDANARAATFGTDSLLATRVWTAVKTGTSKDMRDNWAVGWSQRYTVGVWVGNASGAPMGDVSGTTGAAPVWAGLMRWLHERQPSRAPSPPAGLIAQTVRFGDRLEPSRREWFIAGTEQPLFALGAGGDSGAPDLRPRILSPTTGTILAIDPDIPPAHQRLTLKAEAADVRWRLDDKPLGKGKEVQWMPWPGRHRIEIVNARGELLDSVRIEVRGAGVKTSARP